MRSLLAVLLVLLTPAAAAAEVPAGTTHREPGTSGREADVAGGRLTLPVLRAARRDDLDGGVNAHIAARQPFTVDRTVVEARTARGRR